jgi:hypothetical protein
MLFRLRGRHKKFGGREQTARLKQRKLFWQEDFFMKKKSLFFGIMVLALVFGLLAAGCTAPTDPTDTTGPVEFTDSAAAARLAAEINGIKPGSAELSGATVTIKGGDDGFVYIDNGLTVPRGVTLNVTENGAALGLGDTTLTVNGTVNAGSNHIRLEDSQALINGSGTIYLKSKGSLLSVSGNHNVAERKLTLDGVTLVGLKDNNEPLVGIGNGGEFILKSGAITGNTAKNGGGVKVGGNAEFTKAGGTIYGDTDTTHTTGSTENTAASGYGHAVMAGGKYRNADAGPGIKLYAKYEEGDGWTYNDTDGVGDTTANWAN